MSASIITITLCVLATTRGLGFLVYLLIWWGVFCKKPQYIDKVNQLGKILFKSWASVVSSRIEAGTDAYRYSSDGHTSTGPSASRSLASAPDQRTASSDRPVHDLTSS